MAAKNRPLPPSAIYIGQKYNTALNVYNWANEQNHSLDRSTKFSSGSAVWSNVVDTGAGQSGCLRFLFVAVRNTSGTKDFGARVQIDGSYVYNDNTLTVGVTQTGIALAGRLLFTAATTPKAGVMDELFFEKRLVIDVWVDNPGITMIILSKLYYS